MHNNGSNRLILPGEKQILSPDAEPIGVQVQVRPQGPTLIITQGNRESVVTLTPEEAANTGSGLIGAAAIVTFLRAQKQAVQPVNAEALQDRG